MVIPIPRMHAATERKIEGTNFIVNGMFKPFAIRHGNPITGQQQKSGTQPQLW